MLIVGRKQRQFVKTVLGELNQHLGGFGSVHGDARASIQSVDTKRFQGATRGCLAEIKTQHDGVDTHLLPVFVMLYDGAVGVFVSHDQIDAFLAGIAAQAPCETSCKEESHGKCTKQWSHGEVDFQG